jgi:hypothetical protein
MRIFFLLLQITSILCFINFPFGPKFKISDREVNKKLAFKISNAQKGILKKINGFYGLIGPDINMNNISNIYDLFTGDGLIQGIFFNNGELTFVKHFIRTDKLIYEERNGRIPNNNFIKLIFDILSKVNLLPDLLGLANTAILNINKNAYALYERDSPYKINIDFKNTQIETIKKNPIEQIKHFSAHSKYNINKNTIETIDYNILSNSVNFFVLDSQFNIINKKQIEMNYLPIVHDFWSSNDSIYIFDCPLIINLKNIFNSTMPVVLDINKPTFLHVLNKTTNSIKKYTIDNGIYIFHYANCIENQTHIEMHAAFYDEINFSELNIQGKYRKLIINKITNETIFIKNIEFENLNLDFPLLYGNKTVLRSLNNSINNGFVVCEDLKIKGQILFDDLFICGEPAIINIEGTFYLLSFVFSTKNNMNSGLLILNLETYEKIEIPILESLTLGFHSLFLHH